jgi:TonB family protein
MGTMKRRFLGACIFTTIAVTGPARAAAQTQHGYFPADAYPADAVRHEQEGRVVTHLVVGPDGSVKACTVKITSGFPALDAGACDIARKKIHYNTPARNAAGQPVESELDLPIRFKLPSTPPPESKIQN